MYQETTTLINLEIKIIKTEKKMFTLSEIKTSLEMIYLQKIKNLRYIINIYNIDYIILYYKFVAIYHIVYNKDVQN